MARHGRWIRVISRGNNRRPVAHDVPPRLPGPALRPTLGGVNFLAHLVLSDRTGPSMIGNLLPDLVRPRLAGPLHPEVAAGVVRHRRVDAFTDTHPVFARSRARLRERHGLYASVLVDVLYDHVLSLTWSRYETTGRRAFIAGAYRLMREDETLMPEPMPRIIRAMAGEDWLGAYASPEGLRLIFRRMSARFRERFDRPVELERVVDDLPAVYDPLAADFAEFFPQLLAYTAAEEPPPPLAATPAR